MIRIKASKPHTDSVVVVTESGEPLNDLEEIVVVMQAGEPTYAIIKAYVQIEEIVAQVGEVVKLKPND